MRRRYMLEMAVVRYVIPETFLVVALIFLFSTICFKKVLVTGISPKMLIAMMSASVLKTLALCVSPYKIISLIVPIVSILLLLRLFWSISVREGLSNLYDSLGRIYVWTIVYAPLTIHVCYAVIDKNYDYPELGPSLIEALATYPQYVYMKKEVIIRRHVLQFLILLALKHLVHACSVITLMISTQKLIADFWMPVVLIAIRVMGCSFCVSVACYKYDPPMTDIIKSPPSPIPALPSEDPVANSPEEPSRVHESKSESKSESQRKPNKAQSV